MTDIERRAILRADGLFALQYEKHGIGRHAVLFRISETGMIEWRDPASKVDICVGRAMVNQTGPGLVVAVFTDVVIE